jgi:O-antigen/teichoic acid export membrane protein
VRDGGKRWLGRLGRWIPLLSTYFGAQAVVQAAGLVAGLLIVRALPVEAFGLYTLATSMLTAATYLTDLGSTASLTYFARRAVESGGALDTWIAAVRSLRLAGLAAAAAVVLLALPWVGAARGFPLLDLVASTILVVLTLAGSVVLGIRLHVLRLDLDVNRAYRAELVGALLRLGAAAALLLLAVRQAAFALAGAALAAWVSVVLAQGRRVGEAGATAAHRREVLRYLLPTLPSGLYFAVQGPLVVWLATAFGGVQTLAEVGALGRLGLVFSLFSALPTTLFLPRLVNLTDERAWRMRVLGYCGVLILLLAGAFSVLAAFPGLLLRLIGPAYDGLDAELQLVFAGAAMGQLGGYFVGVNYSRSWLRWQGLAAALMVAGQAALAVSMPLGTTAGLLWFNLASGTLGLALQVGIWSIGVARPKVVSW